MPSGHLPSVRERPVGSLVTGITAELKLSLLHHSIVVVVVVVVLTKVTLILSFQ